MPYIRNAFAGRTYGISMLHWKFNARRINLSTLYQIFIMRKLAMTNIQEEVLKMINQPVERLF